MNILCVDNYVVPTFCQQPPFSLRKSNFFSFSLNFKNEFGMDLAIKNAYFVGLMDQPHCNCNFLENKNNGIYYIVTLVAGNGDYSKDEINLHIIVRIVDSRDQKIVQYEGQDNNPEMRRVLITHEITCNRCKGKKSCGNKSETPSTPQIMNGTELKFYMKCNQNCLKSAGNPRDNRRFKIAIFGPNDMTMNYFALSHEIFVHNNSKHGQRPSYSRCPPNKGRPQITHMFPHSGSVDGGTTVCISGEYLTPNTTVFFENVYVYTWHKSQNCLIIVTPPWEKSGNVRVVLHVEDSFINYSSNLFYEYTERTHDQFDYMLQSPTLIGFPHFTDGQYGQYYTKCNYGDYEGESHYYQ